MRLAEPEAEPHAVTLSRNRVRCDGEPLVSPYQEGTTPHTSDVCIEVSDDPATMSYAQLLRAYQALQEHVIALEGAAALQHSAPPWEHEAQHTAGTGATVSVPEAYLTGGGEMGQRIRAHNWSATPLGPVATWPQSLKSAVSILLPSKAQIILFWGPELIAIYNDAYAPVFGTSIRGPSVSPRASAGARYGTSSARSLKA